MAQGCRDLLVYQRVPTWDGYCPLTGMHSRVCSCTNYSQSSVIRRKFKILNRLFSGFMIFYFQLRVLNATKIDCAQPLSPSKTARTPHPRHHCLHQEPPNAPGSQTDGPDSGSLPISHHRVQTESSLEQKQRIVILSKTRRLVFNSFE